MVQTSEQPGGRNASQWLQCIFQDQHSCNQFSLSTVIFLFHVNVLLHYLIELTIWDSVRSRKARPLGKGITTSTVVVLLCSRRNILLWALCIAEVVGDTLKAWLWIASLPYYLYGVQPWRRERLLQFSCPALLFLTRFWCFLPGTYVYAQCKPAIIVLCMHDVAHLQWRGSYGGI